MEKGWMNQKIKNATKITVDGIEFKSQLEKNVYNIFKDAGFDIQYEPTTFILWKEYTSKIPFFDKETKTQWQKRQQVMKSPRLLVEKLNKISAIRYTPDFYFKYKDLDVYIETKGFENDVFYLKKKLFRAYLDLNLEKTGQESIYFEIYSQAQAIQTIEIIRDYAKEP